ncbi:MAG: hypothetical protein ACRCXD_08070, partial [Luteolibacter sp.]
TPKPAYIAIPVPGWSSATHSFPVALNNRNDVLTNRAVYKNGQWISLNANFSPTGRGAALSYKFLIAGRLHPCRLGQCFVNSISDQGHIMGSGKIFIDDVTVTDPVTGEITGYAAGYSPEFAMIWRNPQALPEIFGIAPGATLQGAFHAQSGTLHRDGTVIISNKRPEDIFVNNNATLQRWPNAANGGGIQASPPYSSPTYSYPAPGGTFAFGSYLDSGQIPATLSWVWPASSGPQSLYSVTKSAPGAPALNFQSLPNTIGSAPGGEACVNLSGQVLVGHSGRYHQVPALQGATKISPHGAALLPGTFGNPAIWYGGSTYSLSSCVANPQALGTTLTVRDMNENGSMLAIVNAGLGSQRLVILNPVDILDSDNNPTNELEVAKMQVGAFNTLSPNGTLSPGGSNECFYIRVRGNETAGGISVKISTTDNPDPSYNEVAKQIDLEFDGTDWISESMLMVSDDVDDTQPVDGIPDNEPNDRTHKIQLGGNFKIEAIKIGNSAWQEIDIRTPVKVKKTVHVNVVILRNKPLSEGGVELFGLTDAISHWKTVNELYAQVGVKIIVDTYSYQDPPVGVNLIDGLKVHNLGSTVLEDEAKSIITNLGTIGTSDIHVFYVPTIDIGSLVVRGIAIADYYHDDADEEYTYNAFVAKDVVGAHYGLTAAHELGHLLTNFGHGETIQNPYPYYNLMFGGGLQDTGITGSKRLYEHQEGKIHSDPHAE